MPSAERQELPLAAPPAYAAHHAIHPHRGHPAKPRSALARSPRDRARPPLPPPIPAARAASRPHAPAAPPAVHHPETHTDSHSEFRARTATALECPPPARESRPTPSRAAPTSIHQRP